MTIQVGGQTRRIGLALSGGPNVPANAVTEPTGRSPKAGRQKKGMAAPGTTIMVQPPQGRAGPHPLRRPAHPAPA